MSNNKIPKVIKFQQINTRKVQQLYTKYIYKTVKAVFCSNRMTNIDMINILNLIAQKSKKVREFYTSHGFSNQEINKYFLRFITTDEETEDICHSQSVASGTNKIEKAHEEDIAFDSVLISQLKRHKNDLIDFLSSILGKMEHQLAQLQQYQKQCESFVLNQPCQSISQISQQQSVQYQPSLKKLIESTCEEQQKKSNNGSTQAESFMEQQEAQIQNSLHALIMKTKMLRSILQKQMISTSMLGIRGRCSQRMSAFADYLLQ